MRTLLLALLLAVAPARAAELQMAALDAETARAVRPVVQAAGRSFTRMPAFRLTSAITDLCRGGAGASRDSRYCTSENAIYIAADLGARRGPDVAAYIVAHQAGHAVQVRHGIADRALAMITADRSREAELRALVSAQVDCIAGAILARAGLPVPDLLHDPFATSHWGRTPLSAGPRIAIGTEARLGAVRKGHAGGRFEICAAGPFDVDMLARALR